MAVPPTRIVSNSEPFFDSRAMDSITLLLYKTSDEMRIYLLCHISLASAITQVIPQLAEKTNEEGKQ